MSDRNELTDQELRDLLLADATRAGDARPGFEQELRDRLVDEWEGVAEPDPAVTASPRQRRGMLVGIAAATVAVVAGGAVVLTDGGADERIGPADTVAPEPTTVGPTPTTVAEDTFTPVEPAPTTVVGESVEPSQPTTAPTEPVATVEDEPVTVDSVEETSSTISIEPWSPELTVLADWSFGEPESIDDVPHPLLDDAQRSVDASEFFAAQDPRTEGDGAFYSRIYVDPDRNASLIIHTSFAPPDVVPVADGAEVLDPALTSQPWPLALRRTNRPEEFPRVDLYDGNGEVRVESIGLSTPELEAAAFSLELTEGGTWEVPALPDGMELWFDGPSGLVPSAAVGWIDERFEGVRIAVSGVPERWDADAFGPVVDGQPTHDFASADVAGQRALVATTQLDARVIWEVEPDWWAVVSVDASYIDDPTAEALRLAELVEFTDEATWIEATGAVCPEEENGVDGCFISRPVTAE